MFCAASDRIPILRSVLWREEARRSLFRGRTIDIIRLIGHNALLFARKGYMGDFLSAIQPLSRSYRADLATADASGDAHVQTVNSVHAHTDLPMVPNK
jgi:hypothetical protein